MINLRQYAIEIGQQMGLLLAERLGGENYPVELELKLDGIFGAIYTIRINSGARYGCSSQISVKDLAELSLRMTPVDAAASVFKDFNRSQELGRYLDALTGREEKP